MPRASLRSPMTADWYIEVYDIEEVDGELIEQVSCIHGPFSEDVACIEVDGPSADTVAFENCTEMIAVHRPDGYPNDLYVNPPEVWFALAD